MGGDELSRYYEGLKQAQLDVLMAKFSEIDDGGAPTKQPKKQAPAPKQQEIRTNIGKKPQKQAPRQQQQQQQEEQHDYADEPEQQ